MTMPKDRLRRLFISQPKATSPVTARYATFAIRRGAGTAASASGPCPCQQESGKAGLLALSGSVWRGIVRIAVSTVLFLRHVVDGMTGLTSKTMRHLLLMRSMLVIVGLEMFLLMLGTFAIRRHEFFLISYTVDPRGWLSDNQRSPK